MIFLKKYAVQKGHDEKDHDEKDHDESEIYLGHWNRFVELTRSHETFADYLNIDDHVVISKEINHIKLLIEE